MVHDAATLLVRQTQNDTVHHIEDMGHMRSLLAVPANEFGPLEGWIGVALECFLWIIPAPWMPIFYEFVHKDIDYFTMFSQARYVRHGFICSLDDGRLDEQRQVPQQVRSRWN